MDLYGLIHSRFIISPRGLTMMREKYVLGTFGCCQRILCDRQLVLPIGLSEELSASRVKVSFLSLKHSDLLSTLLGGVCAPIEALGYRWSILWAEFPQYSFQDLSGFIPQRGPVDVHSNNLWLQDLRPKGQRVRVPQRQQW